MWSAWSDRALRDQYSDFFERLDGLIMLKVPSMDTVRAGRWRQEERAWAEVSTDSASTHPGLMSRAEVDDYVALFERLTTTMLSSMPAYADILIEQDADFGQKLVRMSGG